jgi:hypothetical protein
MTHTLDARLHLLDRQMLDAHGAPVGTVDDLELEGEVGEPIGAGAPPPRVTGLMSGHVLATRILGGAPPASRFQVIPWRLVASLGIVVKLKPTDMVFESQWVEHWLRDHVIKHVPGGRSGGRRDAPQ